jgi:hypothetical protein
MLKLKSGVPLNKPDTFSVSVVLPLDELKMCPFFSHMDFVIHVFTSSLPFQTYEDNRVIQDTCAFSSPLILVSI